MQPQELQQLVEKYYEGNTTLKEERQLLKSLEDFPQSEAYADVLVQLRMMQKLTDQPSLDNVFDEQLLEIIRENTPKKSRWISMSQQWSSIAAAVVLFFALWIGSELVKPTQVYGTINDPQLAFNETTKVLEQVAKNLNKGLDPAKKTTSTLAKSVEKVENAVGKSDQSKKLDKASNYLKSFTKVYINLGKQKTINQ